MEPKVSFIIPCYNLAHFLADSVNSVLSQTYGDFEILIMDDCSPDSTPEVAAEFKDPRVIYIRNEINLGNIRNYNKGIELARGRYIWLISADDCLRSKHVLQRYFDLLEKNPQVGYAFCPAVTLRDGAESGIENWSAWPGTRDRILSSREMLKRSATQCPVCSPTGLVRKELYTRVGGFPVELPRTGDWYLWAAFAVTHDVGYYAEPMVYYRRHSTNMDLVMKEEEPSAFFDQELMAIWFINKAVEKAGMQDLSSDCIRSLVNGYIRRLVEKEVADRQYGLTWEVAKQEILDYASSDDQAEEILRMLHSGWPKALAARRSFIGTLHYNEGKLEPAVASFRSSLASNPWGIRPRFYLGAMRLEKLLGIQLVPWLKLLKSGLFRFLRPLTCRLSFLQD